MTGPGTGETAKGAWGGGHRPLGTVVTVTIAETGDVRGGPAL